MAFASFDPQRRHAPLSDINMVPLIDVMLVLLVIFIVTAPLLTHAVKLDLPRATSSVNLPPPDKIEFAINNDGQRFADGQPVTREQAQAQFAAAAQRQAQTEVHLRADHRVPYGLVAQTLADAGAAGLSRIGFVSSPEAP